MSEKTPSLREYFPKNSPVVFLTSAKQVDKSHDHVILVGSAHCPFCQDGVPQFNSACSDIKGEGTKCLVADVTNPKSLKAIKELGLNPQGVPSHFFWNVDEGKYEEVVGKRKAPEMKQIMKERGFDLD